MIKSEMCLLRGVHAVLPPELRTYRTLALSDPASGTINEREAQMRELPLDLSAVSLNALASLTAEEVLEIRAGATDFFSVIGEKAADPDSFGIICSTVAEYLKRLNNALAYKVVYSGPSRSGKTLVKLVQGKLARHSALLDNAIAIMFKIGTALAHSFYTHHVAIQGGDAAIDVPLKQMEAVTKAAVVPSPLNHLINDIPARLALSPNGERIMQYE
jgi:hypothetical protein